jgi:hypothetical protein
MHEPHLPITENTRVSASPSQVSCQVDGEAVILHLEDMLYYGLNPVGARIWVLVQAPVSVGEVQNALLDEYDVEPEVCRAQLYALLDELAERGLVEIQDEAAH